MKNSVFTLLPLVLFLFFSGVLAAQEPNRFAEAGIESAEPLELILSEPETSSAAAPLGAAPPSMNMVGGFVQFFFFVALTVAVLFGWHLYRKHQAEKFAEYNDNWG